MNMNLPLLVTDLMSFIVVGQKQLYLAIFNDKRENTKVKKTVKESITERRINDNHFRLKLKIGENWDIEAFISENPDLPTTDEYKVMNFDPNSAYRLLLEAENKKGEFNEKVEACFLGGEKELVTFTCQEMSSYGDIENEMIRSFFSKSGRKTKKWIPGHRYDNKEKTFYYLGEFYCRKKSGIDSPFFNTIEELTQVGLYVDSLKGEKTIEDVLKGRSFSKSENDEGIKILWGEKPGCIDSGEILKQDTPLPMLSSMYLDIIKNTPEIVENQLSVYNLLSCISMDEPVGYSEEVKDIVKDLVKMGIKKTLFDNWDIPRSIEDKEIGKKYLMDKNAEKLANLFIISLGDNNILEKTYYAGFFGEMGISLVDVAKDVLKDWNEDDFIKTFEDFLKNKEYFSKRSTIKQTTSFQRSGDTKISIKDLYGDSELTDTLKNLIKYSRDNFGLGVSSFKEIKMSSKEFTITCKITIDDVIDFLGEDKLTSSLKDEILSNRFTKLTIYFDKNMEVE